MEWCVHQPDGITHVRGIVFGEDPDHGLVMIDRWRPPPNAGIANKSAWNS